MRNVISDPSIKRLARLHLLLLWLVAVAISAGAQQVTSTLNGTVNDTSGAVIPLAAATVLTGAGLSIPNLSFRAKRGTSL